ncbi:hypothetical protein [Yoonia sp. R2-816]|uniref:hypothetical protein n=1 Tax=Yoonia sp. R2-816 TaxID=3342638 RepID=UPI00372D65C0
MKFNKLNNIIPHTKRVLDVCRSVPIFFMSPRNDVNRSAKLARGLGPLQQNIVLDSAIDQKESLTSLKCRQITARGQQKNKKRARSGRALNQFILCVSARFCRIIPAI